MEAIATFNPITTHENYVNYFKITMVTFTSPGLLVLTE